MSLDIRVLKNRINILSKKIREELRPKVRIAKPEIVDRVKLRGAKQDVTIMCVLRAQHRGKIHLVGSTLEQQAELLSQYPKMISQFEKKEEPKV
jgi:hypothetical protein